MASLRSDANYRAYGTNGETQPGTGERKSGAREDGHVQERGVRGFKTVKLPTGVRTEKFKNSEIFPDSQLPHNGLSDRHGSGAHG